MLWPCLCCEVQKIAEAAEKLSVAPYGGAMFTIKSMKSFFKDESGVTAIEYGILAAAMAAAVGYIFSSDGAFISALRNKFQDIATDITDAGTGVKH